VGLLGFVLIISLGGFSRAERDEVARGRPGDRLRLARWTITTPELAAAWRGVPYPSYESDDATTHVSVLLRVEATGEEAKAAPTELIDAHLDVAGRAALRLDPGDAQAWLERDRAVGATLQPGLPEQVLVEWELPTSIAPNDVRSMVLRLHDERFEAAGGAFGYDIWRVLPPVREIQLHVRAGDAPGAADLVANEEGP